MINGKDNPVEWAMMSYELEEVIEHLQDLSNMVVPNSSITEEEFEVGIGHIYAHINRIWNSRSHIGDLSEKQREDFTQFPKDIKLYG